MVASFQNMGVMGMITGEANAGDQGLTPEQAEMLKQKYSREYSGPKNRGKPLITSAAIKWQQMGMSPVDLNIIESDKMDMRTICNLFHVPSELFNDAANKTYSNTKEAGSAVYTNAVIPALTQFRDALNQFIKPKYEEKIFIDHDTSLVSELQDDLQQMTTALAGAWWVKPNERRDIMSLAADEENILMNDYLVPVGLMPMSGATVEDAAIEEAAKRLGIKDYEL
jgi:HK97 family phage portal protein